MKSNRASLLLLLGALAMLGAAAWLGLRATPTSDDSTPATLGALPAPTPDTTTTVTVERRLMGTVWTIRMQSANAPAAQQAGEAALDEVNRLEQLLSEWIPSSEISQVNHAAGDHPVRVGRELLACVKASQQVAEWSEGAFDISWAGLRGLWDFSADSAHVPPSEAQVREKLPLWNYHNIVVDEAASTVFLREHGMAIGLGGVAKGYALDRAGELLRARDVPNFLIFGGGQILASSEPGHRPWRVGIAHPRKPLAFASVEISNGSVSTSGDYEHSWEHEGVRYHHILDPHTGFPSRVSASVTVISPTALWADAIDTALFILGPERAMQKLQSAPGGPHEAVIVAPDLALSTTPGAARQLRMRVTLDAQHALGDTLAADVPSETLDHISP